MRTATQPESPAGIVREVFNTDWSHGLGQSLHDIFNGPTVLQSRTPGRDFQKGRKGVCGFLARSAPRRCRFSSGRPQAQYDLVCFAVACRAGRRQVEASAAELPVQAWTTALGSGVAPTGRFCRLQGFNVAANGKKARFGVLFSQSARAYGDECAIADTVVGVGLDSGVNYDYDDCARRDECSFHDYVTAGGVVADGDVLRVLEPDTCPGGAKSCVTTGAVVEVSEESEVHAGRGRSPGRGSWGLRGARACQLLASGSVREARMGAFAGWGLVAGRRRLRFDGVPSGWHRVDVRHGGGARHAQPRSCCGGWPWQHLGGRGP